MLYGFEMSSWLHVMDHMLKGLQYQCVKHLQSLEIENEILKKKKRKTQREIKFHVG